MADALQEITVFARIVATGSLSAAARDPAARGAGSEATKPSPLRPDVMGPLEKVSAELWPGVPVVPQMDPGASDSSVLRARGTPSYGVVGVFTDVEDDRSNPLPKHAIGRW